MSPVTNSLATAARLASRIVVCASALAGCASMAGVGGSAEFGCKAPLGVKCDSVSGTYYNALQQNLPSQQNSPSADAMAAPLAGHASRGLAPKAYTPKAALSAKPVTTTLALTREASAPLRSPARVLRLWIKPWEDSDGDLHSPGYVYVPVDVGRWLIDRVPRPDRDAYRPIKAPQLPSRTGATSTSPSTLTSPRAMPDSTLALRPRSAAAAASSMPGTGDDDGQ